MTVYFKSRAQLGYSLMRASVVETFGQEKKIKLSIETYRRVLLEEVISVDGHKLPAVSLWQRRLTPVPVLWALISRQPWKTEESKTTSTC